MSDGMSTERLAGIRATAQRRDYQHAVVLGDCIEDCGACAIAELLAEVERRYAQHDQLSCVYDRLVVQNGELLGERDDLRAQLDEIGDTKPEWAVRWLDGEIDVADSEGEARDQTHNDAGLTLLQRRVGKQWREVPDA